MSGTSLSAGAVFVKFENDTNDVELINEDRHLQRKSSFDNPTYGAVENLAQAQVSFECERYLKLSLMTRRLMTNEIIICSCTIIVLYGRKPVLRQ